MVSAALVHSHIVAYATHYGSDMNARDGWGIYPAVAYIEGYSDYLSALCTKATKYSIIKHGHTTICVREKGR